jgi:phosphoribosylformylglycinamidine cyclo-ligase
MDYKQAGVDIEEGYRAVGKYREYAQSTAQASMNGAVLNGIGSFAGMFSLKELIAAGAGMEEPVLVSGTDGVGTKLDIAFKLKKYDTVGIDLVAMCVNDVLCHGAKPLFFLDYLACGKLDADVAAELVKGVATGCRETVSVLLGGETAEMPGFYDDGKYDMAGFSVGLVDRKNIVDGGAIREGDALIGLASSGPHSNGFSLIRKAIVDLDEDFGGMPIGRALLEPTRLYVKPVLGLIETISIHGMAHITGGGFYENIPRMFPRSGGGGKAGGAGGAAFDAVIQNGSWRIPPIFARIASGVAGTGLTGAAAREKGVTLLDNVTLLDSDTLLFGGTAPGSDAALRKLMFNTYNMGIGFVLAVSPSNSKTVIEYLDGKGFPAWEIGRAEKAKGGEGAVRFV